MPFSLYRRRHERRRLRLTLSVLLGLLLLAGGLLWSRPRLLPRLLAPLGVELRLAPTATPPPASEAALGRRSDTFDPRSSRAERTEAPAPAEASEPRTAGSQTTAAGGEASAATDPSRSHWPWQGRSPRPPWRQAADGSLMPPDAARAAKSSPSAPEAASDAAFAGDAVPAGAASPREAKPIAAASGRAGSATATEVPEAVTASPGPTAEATRTRPAPSPPAEDPIRRAAGGPMTLEPPLLSFDRPFTEAEERRGSAFYPYGSTAGGQYLMHHGIDISNPAGTPVRAVASGEVIHAGDDLEPGIWGPNDEPYPRGFYGRLVVLRHAETLEGRALYSLYGHLSSLSVRRRQHVTAGQALGAVGSAGIALGPHLHLELRAGGRDYESTLNPDLLLRPLPGLGLIVGRLHDPAGRPLHGIDVGLYALDEAGGESWLRQTTTYPAERINAVPALGENFAFGDLPPGRYRVAAQPGGGRLAGELRVEAGRASGIVLQR